MYKLVFLLIFSAANVTGAKDITLDIDITSEAETSCHVTPTGTQILTEGEHIRFHIQTPTKLNDSWCHNEGVLMINLRETDKRNPTKSNGIFMYTLETTTESYMEGNWTCTYQIFKKDDIASILQRTCSFQVKVTNKPGGVYLNIADLSPLNWKNGAKLYNYSFTLGEETFNCTLANPTEKEEIYTVSFTLDGSLHRRYKNVVLKPHGKVNLTGEFKLNETSKLIVCSAVNVNGDGPARFRAEISLQYLPAPRVHLTACTHGPRELRTGVFFWKNNTQIYHYDFTDGEELTIYCNLNYTDGGYENHYRLQLCNPNKTCTDSKGSDTSISHTFKLENEDILIYCTAFNKEAPTDLSLPQYLHNVVHLRHTQREDAVETGSGESEVKHTMMGLHNNSCSQNNALFQTCHYYTSDSTGILPLKCVLRGAKIDSNWTVNFGTNSSGETKGGSPIIVSYDMPLNLKNNTVTCNATKTSRTENVWIINLTVHYIPQPTTPTTTTMEPTTAPTSQSIEPSQVNSTVPAAQSSDEEDTKSTDWLKWVLGGGALLITICVVVGCLVMYCKKKPPPADSTYANSTKGPTPMPAPRTACKPNVALDNNYSEPKDSQDMSEALYADPNRFVGDSSNYAEPYVAKPNAACDTYAEPFKSNYAEPYSCTSEGNYAELNLQDCSGKELYAKPIPKAQRKPKLKDDCNYSNVFGGQYGNTKK